MKQGNTENNKDKYFHIVTASNEIQNLIKCLPEIDYSKYKKYYLYINNNEVSKKIKLQIFENYPQFEPVVINCDCKNKETVFYISIVIVFTHSSVVFGKFDILSQNIKSLNITHCKLSS